ncbi:MAG: DUF5011 domain-containing protein [Bacteroidales bacterium]|nr:DUF5011 domain-containing protein [Bacteroidales bacterium]
MKYWAIFGLFLIIAGSVSCKKTDDLPPVLTLKGDTLVSHILNTTYVDQGATATDETDGNLNSEIFIDNAVNEDLVGEYTVTYKVLDKAGNEAAPVSRTVQVYNQGWIYMGAYHLSESETFTGSDTCSYDIIVGADSSLNYRLNFSDFVCQYGHQVFADVIDTTIIIPFQLLSDTIPVISVQGSGIINDTIIQLEYTRKVNNEPFYWKAALIRLQ